MFVLFDYQPGDGVLSELEGFCLHHPSSPQLSGLRHLCYEDHRYMYFSLSFSYMLTKLANVLHS